LTYASYTPHNDWKSEGVNEFLSRVLVIDEGNATVELLKPLLEQEAFQVFEVSSGLEGIVASGRQDFSAIILDTTQTENNGWEVCRQIRKGSTAPIIILSVINKPSLVASALDAGADEFLTKPVPAGILMAHLKRLTRRAHAEREASSPKRSRLSP
jgi:DNA-binding response OmpR family regulator